jgi:hypothetical protein
MEGLDVFDLDDDGVHGDDKDGEGAGEGGARGGGRTGGDHGDGGHDDHGQGVARAARGSEPTGTGETDAGSLAEAAAERNRVGRLSHKGDERWGIVGINLFDDAMGDVLHRQVAHTP